MAIDENFTDISSDHLSGARYDAFENKAYVKFQNGYVYAVHGMSPEDYRTFMDAPSQGSHFHSQIKNNFAVERVK